MELVLTPSRVAFSIGTFDVYWYGIIIAFAILLSFCLVFILCKKKKLSKDLPYELILATVPSGVIFARLFSVIFEDGLTIADYFDFRGGGMSIIGAIIGGTIGVALYCLIKKRNFLEMADIILPLVIMSQAIGRWGNYFNQEVYGKEILDPSKQWFPFAVHITKAGVDGWFHALFFYESMLSLIGFALLLTLLFSIKNRKGFVTSAYLMWYGAVRFVLEPLRDPRYILMIGNVPISRVMSGIMFIIGLLLLIYLIFFQKMVKNKMCEKRGKKISETKK